MRSRFGGRFDGGVVSGNATVVEYLLEVGVCGIVVVTV